MKRVMFPLILLVSSLSLICILVYACLTPVTGDYIIRLDKGDVIPIVGNIASPKADMSAIQMKGKMLSSIRLTMVQPAAMSRIRQCVTAVIIIVPFFSPV